MKKFIPFLLGVAAGVCVLWAGRIPFALTGLAEQTERPSKALFTVAGRTRCIPGNKAIIAPAVLHPVEEVLVALGDRVKKGDKLVEIDADEPKADVRAKIANLEALEIVLKHANRLKESVDAVQLQGVLSAQRVHEVHAAAEKAAADARQAKAMLEAAQFELEHYTLEAPIDGVVNRLEVHVGTVSRPGTTVWGEILNLAEIDVGCQLTLSQIDKLEAGQKSKALIEHGMRYYGQEAEVFNKDTLEKYGTGVVVFIGLEADRDGTVPALVRLDNPAYKLRCEAPVQVRFTGGRNGKAIQEQEKKIAHREKERKDNETKKKEMAK
jgi:RND family efflux transporter MFP subunit